MPAINKVLLVYPKVPKHTFWSFHYSLKIIGKKSAMPPLGLITLAALFPDRCRLKLVDLNINPLTDADLLWADAVMVTAMIVQKDSFHEVVSACNRLNRTVVAGGPYPTACPQEMAGVDHVLAGEVEETFGTFFRNLEKGCAPPRLSPAGLPDLARSPRPRFELLDLAAYASMTIQYSRGCPFRCEFCDIWQMYGNRPRVKTAEQIVGELDSLYRLGWKGAVFVVDDNFIGNRKRVKGELLPRLIDWQRRRNRPFQFFTEASVDLAGDDELLDLMVDAGFNEVFVGIETPSAASLKETGKLQNLKMDLQESVLRIQKKGMEVTAGFILGFDSDTADIFDRQIAFIQQAGIPKAMVGVLSALPGTALHHRLKEEGRLVGDSIGNNTHQMTTNFKTRMPEDQLKKGYRKILTALYDDGMIAYFGRCNRLMDRMERTDGFQRPIGWSETVMLFRSLIRQTFSGYGHRYLGFLFRNLFKNRHVFAEAVRMAIQGHHFRNITRQTLKAEGLAMEMERVYDDLSRGLAFCRQGGTKAPQEAFRHLAKMGSQCERALTRIHRRLNRFPDDVKQDLAGRYRQWCEKLENLFFDDPPRTYP